MRHLQLNPEQSRCRVQILCVLRIFQVSTRFLGKEVDHITAKNKRDCIPDFDGYRCRSLQVSGLGNNYAVPPTSIDMKMDDAPHHFCYFYYAMEHVVAVPQQSDVLWAYTQRNGLRCGSSTAKPLLFFF